MAQSTGTLHLSDHSSSIGKHPAGSKEQGNYSEHCLREREEYWYKFHWAHQMLVRSILYKFLFYCCIKNVQYSLSSSGIWIISCSSHAYSSHLGLSQKLKNAANWRLQKQLSLVLNSHQGNCATSVSLCAMQKTSHKCKGLLTVLLSSILSGYGSNSDFSLSLIKVQPVSLGY